MTNRFLTVIDITRLCASVAAGFTVMEIEYNLIRISFGQQMVELRTADLTLPDETFLDKFPRRMYQEELARLVTTNAPPRMPGPAVILSHEPPEQVRGATHGDYTQTAAVAQNIKASLRRMPSLNSMAPVQLESLDSIATKLARIMCGDSRCEDHWRDIAGYANLVADRIANGELK